MNTALTFETPAFLFALLGLIPLILVWLLRFRIMEGRFREAAFGVPLPRRRYVLSGLFFGIFLVLLVLALAGPRWGSRVAAEYRRGLDVVFALDLSRSMEIRDVPGRPGGAEVSRLERGLEIARETAAALPGVRFAAAVGKGRGLLAVPLTGDMGAVLAFFEGLGGLSLTGRGTNLEALVDAAASAFNTPFPARQIIVLVSDGEALSGSLQGALEGLREAGITLIALGLGSDEGSPVPDAAGSEAQGAISTAPSVPAVTPAVIPAASALSRREGEVLRYAAEWTGGIYIDGNDHTAAALLGEHLKSLAPETQFQGGRREPEPRRHLFIIAAILAFGASKLCMMRRRKRVLSAALLVLLSSCSGVSGKLRVIEGNFYYARGMYSGAAASYSRALEDGEAAPYAEYGLGTAVFSRDGGNAALEQYAAAEHKLETAPAEEHRELRYRIAYNSGLVFFGQGDYGAAAKAFRRALELDGSRIEAKRNLELSLLSLSRDNGGTGQKKQDGPPGEAEAALFEYLRLKEQNQWKSRTWIEEENFSGPDY
jgi:Ca-activated chloride channel family protein